MSEWQRGGFWAIVNWAFIGHEEVSTAAMTWDSLAALVDSLTLLAASPSEQAAYLRKLGPSPCADELALEFDDVVRLVPVLLQEGRLLPDQAAAIEDVNRKVMEMGGQANSELWTEDAVQMRAEWQEVRQLARRVLMNMNMGTTT